YALLLLGATHIEIVDISNPAAPRRVLRDTHPGLLYGDQIADGLVQQRYACAFWHSSGIYWYDLEAPGGPALTGHLPGRLSMLDGVAPWGDRALVVTRGGYVLLAPGEERPLETLPCFRPGNAALTGKPVIVGDRLYLTQRASGRVTVVDIAHPEAPRVVEEFSVRGNPGRVALQGNLLLIPAGYEGVLVGTR
ncbi:MAG: hypothetical protein QHJ73_15710, partial [Armatimonadota bacterium]|nr:hypothetical protein [Armatimonadota bacterium]